MIDDVAWDLFAYVGHSAVLGAKVWFRATPGQRIRTCVLCVTVRHMSTLVSTDWLAGCGKELQTTVTQGQDLCFEV